MQRLEVSGAVRPIYGSLGVKRLTLNVKFISNTEGRTQAELLVKQPVNKQISR